MAKSFEAFWDEKGFVGHLFSSELEPAEAESGMTSAPFDMSLNDDILFMKLAFESVLLRPSTAMPILCNLFTGCILTCGCFMILLLTICSFLLALLEASEAFRAFRVSYLPDFML